MLMSMSKVCNVIDIQEMFLKKLKWNLSTDVLKFRSYILGQRVATINVKINLVKQTEVHYQL